MNSTTLANNPTLPDLMLEASGWAIVYTIVILNGVVPTLRKLLQAQPFWQEMSGRKGQILTTMAEESVLTLSLSIHHICAGTLMLLGQVSRNDNLWLHGLLVEIAFEIVDVGCLLVNAYPYPQVQPGLRFITLLHHFPGLFAAPNLVMAGFHRNEHLQQIGWALLLAGGITLLTDGLKQTRSLGTQLGQWLFLHCVSFAGVLAARFYIFPFASMGLLQDMSSGPEYLYYLCGAGIVSMALFNLVIVVILTEKLFRYGWAWIKGKPAGKELIISQDKNVKVE
jgi:hypothetical protein